MSLEKLELVEGQNKSGMVKLSYGSGLTFKVELVYPMNITEEREERLLRLFDLLTSPEKRK